MLAWEFQCQRGRPRFIGVLEYVEQPFEHVEACSYLAGQASGLSVQV